MTACSAGCQRWALGRLVMGRRSPSAVKRHLWPHASHANIAGGHWAATLRSQRQKGPENAALTSASSSAAQVGLSTTMNVPPPGSPTLQQVNASRSSSAAAKAMPSLKKDYSANPHGSVHFRWSPAAVHQGAETCACSHLVLRVHERARSLQARLSRAALLGLECGGRGARATAHGREERAITECARRSEPVTAAVEAVACCLRRAPTVVGSSAASTCEGIQVRGRCDATTDSNQQAVSHGRAACHAPCCCPTGAA